MAGQAWARGPAGDNIAFGSTGYGAKTAICRKISHGMGIVSTQGQSRNGSAFYPTKVTSGSFTVELVFADHGEYTEFARWMEGYCRRAADPDGQVSAMRVICPARNFDKVAIPQGEQGPPVSYGDAWDAVTYTLTIGFEGSRDPLEFDSPLISKFVKADVDWETSQNFYPAGNLQQGEDAVNLTVLAGAVAGATLGTLGQQSNPVANPTAPKTPPHTSPIWIH